MYSMIYVYIVFLVTLHYIGIYYHGDIVCNEYLTIKAGGRYAITYFN